MSIRVAAAQFGTGTDVDANLATCLRMLDRAAASVPHLVVLPEFCNHLSWYDSPDHCRDVAVELDGPFLSAFRDRVRSHGLYAVINCTVRRGADAVTGTSLLFAPDGELLAESDKQVLIGHENDFLRRADAPCPIVETAIGRIGMYACMDGVINETPRGLALRGAQILCNSLNSFAVDEGSLHVPVRAPENRVFVVAANKIGPLIPEALLGPVSEATNIPARFLYGAGESQIVAPDGQVLAKASTGREEVVVAEIDVRTANDKRRPDGTDVFASRRPELYAPIGQDPREQPEPDGCGADRVDAAGVQLSRRGREAIVEAAARVREAAAGGARLVVLPELFCFEADGIGDLVEAETRSVAAVGALAEACGEDCFVATSVVSTDRGSPRHLGVLVGARGIVLRQPQLHSTARHPWATPGDDLATVDLPWGRVALVVGDDSLYPEMFRLLALSGAEVAAVPLRPLEDWELRTGLVERSAENRINVVAPALITSLQADFTLMTPWQDRPFDGLLSHPIVTRAAEAPATVRAAIHPAVARNKVVSHRTDLVRGRPWHLAGAITAVEVRK